MRPGLSKWGCNERILPMPFAYCVKHFKCTQDILLDCALDASFPQRRSFGNIKTIDYRLIDYIKT